MIIPQLARTLCVRHEKRIAAGARFIGGSEWPEQRGGIDAPYVRERRREIVKDQDVSRYIL